MPSFTFEVEYSKSNRAACKKCKDKIPKDVVRVGFKAEVSEDAEGAAAHMGCSWHHFECFAKAKGQPWFKKHLTAEVAEAVSGLESLKEDDRAAVQELFKACRGEVPMPVAPAAPTAENETPNKATKKRKGKGDDEVADASSAKAAKVAESHLTEEQIAAIAEAKGSVASKNAAYLGAILAKNGLPKTGRKDELLDRVAENKVLGVPPTCDVCEKKKLSWSRSTGKYTCPGFFDDEAKAFKKCKGPTVIDVQRTPWQEL